MYWSGGEETHSLSAKLDANFQRSPDSLTTNASVKVQEFAHVHNKFKVPKIEEIEKSEDLFKKVETNLEEIPEIKLHTPVLAPEKSKVQSELGVNVQNRTENKRTETLLKNQPIVAPTEQASTNIQITNINKIVVEPPQSSVIVVRHKNAEFSSPEEHVLAKSQDDEVSCSDNVPILFARRKSLMIPEKETDIINSDEDDQLSLKLQDFRNSIYEKFKLKKHRRNYKVNAFIYPAVRFQLIATVSGNDFQVDVDCESEYFYDSVVVLADSFYASQAYVPNKRTRRESSDFSDEDTLEAHEQPDNLNNYSRMSVSINARSVNDTIQASLEVNNFYSY